MTDSLDKPTEQSLAERMIDVQPYISTTYVRTPPVISGGLTAWHLRQFVLALDAAEIPDSALINERKAYDTLHLIELSTRIERTLPAPHGQPDTQRPDPTILGR